MLSFLSHVGGINLHLIIIYQEYLGYHTAIIIFQDLSSIDMDSSVDVFLKNVSAISTFLRIMNLDA
jgi:hypothetical protein